MLTFAQKQYLDLPIQRILIGIGFILHKWEKSLFMTMMELYAKLAVLNPII